LTMADVAQRYEIHFSQIYAWQQPVKNVGRAVDAGIGINAEMAHECEVAKLHFDIRQRTVVLVESQIGTYWWYNLP
jgi:transposase